MGIKTAFSTKLRGIFNIEFLKYNYNRVAAIAEKNLKLLTRYKIPLLSNLTMPIISIIMPLILLQKFFAFGDNFGVWTETNFYVFLLMAYNIDLLRKVIVDFPSIIGQEKWWKTLPALLIAPFSKFHFLIGTLISHIIVISIPFTLFFVLAYLIYPISFWTVIVILTQYLLIDLTFAGLGLIVSVFMISQESVYSFLNVAIDFIFWGSCLLYPLTLFPEIIQSLIRLNPLYYMFDILRTTWIDNNILLTISTYPFQFTMLIGISILIPLVSVIIFNSVYKKFGITGY